MTGLGTSTSTNTKVTLIEAAAAKVTMETSVPWERVKGARQISEVLSRGY